MSKSYKLIRKAKPVTATRYHHRSAHQSTEQLKRSHALSVLPFDQEDEDDRGTGSSGRGKPRIRDLFGLPQEETRGMYIEQRELEQAGHRRLGKVNAREKSAELPVGDPQAGEGYQAHPLLSKSQRFDGIDPNVNPTAAIAARDPLLANELDKEKAKQEHDKELRLSLQKERRNEHSYSKSSSPTLTR